MTPQEITSPTSPDPSQAAEPVIHGSFDLESATPQGVAAAVEAAILCVDRPLSHMRIAEALGLVAPEFRTEDDPSLPPDDPASHTNEEPGTPPISKRRAAQAKSRRQDLDRAGTLIAGAVNFLNESYASSGRSFRIEQIAGGYRFMSLAPFAPVVAAVHRARNATRLSRASIESLAIIAYKQPITRAQLEAIRGVACGEVLRSLMERRLVTIKGRAEELGRPILYATSRQFLDHFGLSSLTELPTLTELKPGA